MIPFRIRLIRGIYLACVSFLLSVSHPFAQTSSPVDDEDSFLLDTLWDRVQLLPPAQRPAVGVALGGGGARGLAHIGVLKVLEEEDITVDRLSGTSVGALIGALYAAGVSTQELEAMSREVGWNSLTNYSRYTLLRLIMTEQGLSSERMEKYLAKKMGDVRFDELRIPFICAATDLRTGERVVFREGSVALAARASATIPGLFEPVNFRHRFLVDGGLVSNLPTDLVLALGAELVIGVDVTSDFSGIQPSGVLGAMNQAIYIQSEALSRQDRARADIVIRPMLGDIGAMDINRGKECIDAGIAGTRRAIPLIKRSVIDHTWNALMSNSGRR